MMIRFLKAISGVVFSGLIGMVLGLLFLLLLKFLASLIVGVSIVITSSEVCSVGILSFLALAFAYIIFLSYWEM
jgi:hypothetical protein